MSVLTNQEPTVTITSSAGDSVCLGTPTTLTLSSTWGGTSPAYNWYLNGIPTATGTIYTYIPADGDVIFATMLSSYKCRLDSSVLSNNIKFDVDRPDTPTVRIDFYPNSSAALDSYQVVVTNDPFGQYAYTYTWYVNGDLMPQTTSYLLVVPGSLANGAQITCIVTRHNRCGLYPGAGIYNNVNVGVTPVTVTVGDIRLIPNPNKGLFSLKGSLGVSTSQDVYIEITDMLGQVIYRSTTTAHNGEIDEQIQLGGNIANGMYMVNLRSGGANKVFHMVIEQ